MFIAFNKCLLNVSCYVADVWCYCNFQKFDEEGGAGTSGTSTGASDTDPDDKDPSKDKKKKNRCAVCRKKVGLTGKY